MITRTADFARETSATQKQPETTQIQTAAMVKSEGALDQTRVNATTESDMEHIRTDVDAEGSGAEGEGGSKKEEHEMTEEQQRELLVAPAPHEQLIDIMW